MNANVVSSNEFQAIVRDSFDSVGDWTDLPCTVSLVEGDFNPKVKATYPAASAAFTPLVAGATWEIQYDSTSGRFYLVAPDPDEGWDFVALSGGVTISGFKIHGLDAAVERVGANLFATPIAVGAAGEHITLPWVALDVTDVILDAINPYVLP